VKVTTPGQLAQPDLPKTNLGRKEHTHIRMKSTIRQTHRALLIGGNHINVPLIKSAATYRALIETEIPLPRGCATTIAAALKVNRHEVYTVLRLIRSFTANPAVKEKWEPVIYDGKRNAAFILREIAKESALTAHS
jgi:hypothetical protein